MQQREVSGKLARPEGLGSRETAIPKQTARSAAQVGVRVAWAQRALQSTPAAGPSAVEKDRHGSTDTAESPSNKATRLSGERETEQVKRCSRSNSESGTHASMAGDIAAREAAQLKLPPQAEIAIPAELPKTFEARDAKAVPAARSLTPIRQAQGLAPDDPGPGLEDPHSVRAHGQVAERSEETKETQPAPTASIVARDMDIEQGISAPASSHPAANDRTLRLAAAGTKGETKTRPTEATAEPKPSNGASQPAIRVDSATRAGAEVAKCANPAAAAVDARLAGSTPGQAAPANPMSRSADAIRAAAPRGGESETFAALDAGAPHVTWIQAGARRAEAGYLDPALGWVGVRAETTGNVLHATVVPGSAEAAQTLGSHLAGLNAFLTAHHGQSANLTLATPESGPRGSEFDQQASGQRHDQHRDASPDRGAELARARTEQITTVEDSPAPVAVFEPAAVTGGHISVIA